MYFEETKTSWGLARPHLDQIMVEVEFRLYELDTFCMQLHYAKFQFIWMRNGWEFNLKRLCSASSALLQIYCMSGLWNWSFPFYLKCQHAKFRLNLLRNSWDISCSVFVGSAVLHGILHSCKVTVFDLRLDPFHLQSHHAKFQLNLLRNGSCESFVILNVCESFESCESRMQHHHPPTD